MTCQCRSMSRTLSASSTQRLVSQAHGHNGSNQKSTRAFVGALCTASVMVWLLSVRRPADRAGPAAHCQSRSPPACSRHQWAIGGGAPQNPSSPHGKLPGVAVPNLTRTDAAARAELLTVQSYDLQLDVTDGDGHPGEHTFRSVTTVE